MLPVAGTCRLFFFFSCAYRFINFFPAGCLYFHMPAEANSHIKNLDEELANKYDETNKHREEITSLLGQLVSQRHKIREVKKTNKKQAIKFG